MLALGVVATGIAYLLYFGLIGGAGPSTAILVTYLVPSTALVYAATLLDEPVGARQVAGLALVLGGVALGTGAVRPQAGRYGADVTRSYPVLIGTLAFVWGASYLFIKVAVEEIEPAPAMFLRLAVAAGAARPVRALARGRPLRPRGARGAWRPASCSGSSTRRCRSR